MEEEDVVSLGNIGEGAIIEKFDDEFQRVIKNISDPNTDLSTREVTLKCSIKPSDNREMCEIVISFKSKLGGVKSYKGMIFVGMDPERGYVAREPANRQMGLPLGKKEEKRD